MKIIEDQTFDMERALYGSRGVYLKNALLTVLRTGRAH